MNDVSKILLVEDHDDTRKLLIEILKTLGVVIIEAKNGYEGYEKFLDNKISVVVTDMYMEPGDGSELIKKIKKKNKDVKILVLSCNEKEKFNIQNDIDVVFMTKPFSIFELTDKVRELLRNSYLENGKKCPICFK